MLQFYEISKATRSMHFIGRWRYVSLRASAQEVERTFVACRSVQTEAKSRMSGTEPKDLRLLFRPE